MTRGGKRSGAGRKPGSGKYGEKTAALRLPESMVAEVLEFVAARGYQMPLYESSVQAGAPAPADDQVTNRVNLNDLLVRQPQETFLVRAQGNSMIDAGIQSGDLLVVDRGLTPASGKIVIAVVDGDLTVKRLQQGREAGHETLTLKAENPEYADIPITTETAFSVWGVVTNVIHTV